MTTTETTGLPSLSGLTEPERWETLLDAFSVPDYPAVYVLGCFARRVTFYSQQVRALNFVDALCNSGRVTGRRELAVIGAGVAGLTAAAALLRRGAPVRIFERRADPGKIQGRMPLQQGCKQRVVHPHIYDWPAKGATRPEAGLPVLDWQAASAAKVIAEIGEKFAAVVQENPERVRFEHATDISITAAPATLAWGGKAETFEAIILAVGFGSEGDATGWHSYWTDDDVESSDALAGGPWLISGYGDGALTDLMRLSITQFDHKDFLEDFSSRVAEADAGELAKADRAGANGKELAQLYRRVAGRIDLQKELRAIDVWLNCTEEQLFSPQSSILNRLVAAFLLGHPDNRIRLVPRPAKIATPYGVRGGYAVTPEVMDRPTAFRSVIVRHGPARAIQDFAGIWSACARKFEQWQSTAPGVDWTRMPQWRDGAFDQGVPSLLAPDVETKARCLVVHAGKAKNDEPLNVSVRHALKRLGRDRIRFETLELDPEPLVLNVEDILERPARYAYAVRAICTCQLAVFDVTDAQPGVALLLGIRAAVRRGVTVTVVRHALDAAQWAELPFNIREVGFVSAVPQSKVIERIYAAVRDGIHLLASIGEHYRDLPGYDALRRLGSDKDFFLPVPAATRALLLSWYDADYVSTVGQQIERCLQTQFRDQEPLRIINTPSPQLTSDKLYAEIRRVRFCVADWTGWRFNVFFELGVRLSVNSDEPASLLCEDLSRLSKAASKVPQEGAQHHALRRLFSPFIVRLDDTALEQYFEECHKAIENGARWPGRAEESLPRGYTYALVTSSIRKQSEPWGVPVWRRLISNAWEILGQPDRTNPVSPVLFAEIDKKGVVRAGIEHLVAAWLFVDYSIEHGGADALENERTVLGKHLYSILEDRGLLTQREYGRLKERLEELDLDL